MIVNREKKRGAGFKKKGVGMFSSEIEMEASCPPGTDFIEWAQQRRLKRLKAAADTNSSWRRMKQQEEAGSVKEEDKRAKGKLLNNTANTNAASDEGSECKVNIHVLTTDVPQKEDVKLKRGVEGEEAAVEMKVHRPRRVGKYELGAVLGLTGRGVLGKLRLAVDTTTDHPVMLSVYDKGQMLREQLDGEIKKEVAFLKSLSRCRYVLQLQECVQTARHIYMVLERLSKKSLLEFMIESEGGKKEKENKEQEEEEEEPGTLEISRAKMYMTQIMLAIYAMQDHGFCCDNLCLDDFLLTEDQKEIRFYNMHALQIMEKSNNKGGPGQGESFLRPRLEYLAPELIHADEAQKAASGRQRNTEMWAVGVCLYAMLVGEFPLEGNELSAKISRGDWNEKALRKKYVKKIFAGKEAAKIWSDAKDLISKLLVVDPSKRLSCTEALAHPFIGIRTDGVETWLEDGSTVPGELIPIDIAGVVCQFVPKLEPSLYLRKPS